MKKRILAVIVCLAMVFTGAASFIGQTAGLGVTAEAATEETVVEENAEVTLEDRVAEIQAMEGKYDQIHEYMKDLYNTDSNQYTELRNYIQNNYKDELSVCLCDKPQAYGEWHGIYSTCSWSFANIPVEDQYAIYKNLSNADKAIYKTRLKFHSGKWEALEEYMNNNSQQEIETTVDKYGIKVSGDIPEDVQLTAEENYNNDISACMHADSKIVFALDLTPQYEDGTAWQPGEGESVEVVLDAEALGLEDGDRLNVIHEKDNGELEKLTVCEVKNGVISFETSGFSVFYGYTVDFVYDGKTHSIGGGTSIFLSDLFDALGIERFTNDVESVEFSDYSLLEVTRVQMGESESDRDWRIVSLEPFQTEEQLTITFESGEELLIQVYDANITTLNKNATWNDEDVITKALTVEGKVTITLKGIVYMKESITVPDGATLTINGNGDTHTLRAAANGFNMFNVEGTGKLILNNVTLNARANWDGTPVDALDRSNTNVAKENSSGTQINGFTKVRFLNVNGSSAESAKVTINNCVMTNSEHYNSCIKIINGDVTIKNNSILRRCSNNLVNKGDAGDVGVIHIPSSGGNNNSTLNITNSTIWGCYTGKTYGGTIRTNVGTVATINLTNCTAHHNYSNRNGGVILYNVGKASSDAEKCVIKNCNFYNNTAGERGGAIVLLPYTLSDQGTAPHIVIGEGCTFTGNRASNGGAIAVLVKENVAGEKEKKYEVILDIDLGSSGYIRNNTADGTIKEVGTADAGTAINIPNTEGCGGAVFIETTALNYTTNLELTSGEISNNTCKTDTTPDLNGSDGGGHGGGIYVTDTDVNFGEITVSKNTAPKNGGGVYLTQTATADGVGKITMSKGTITENTASGNGGGIYVNKGTMKIQGGSVTNNQADENGGAIYAAEEAGVTVAGGKIETNTAGIGGGGVATNGGSVTINNGSISNNIAANGGGIYAINGGDVVMNGDQEAIVTGNKAINKPTLTTAYKQNAGSGLEGTGGGIYVADGVSESNKSTFTLEGSTVGIYNNEADFAADDVFANGNNTKLDVPTVDEMTLTGMDVKPTGWFEDYVKGDTEYSNDKAVNALNYTDDDEYKVERYKVASAGFIAEVPVTDDGLKANADDLYVCMTLGIGYGNLTIQKTGLFIDSDQIFVFKIEGEPANENLDEIEMTVTVKGSNAVTIYNLPYGKYTVTEENGWSWRYKLESIDGDGTIDKDNEEAVIKVTNSLNTDKWLTDSFDVNNIYGIPKLKVGE